MRPLLLTLGYVLVSAWDTVIVPEEVIGLPETDRPPPLEIATEVTVPLGSSPEGITAHSVPLDIMVSPTLHTGAVA